MDGEYTDRTCFEQHLNDHINRWFIVLVNFFLLPFFFQKNYLCKLSNLLIIMLHSSVENSESIIIYPPGFTSEEKFVLLEKLLGRLNWIGFITTQKRTGINYKNTLMWFLFFDVFLASRGSSFRTYFVLFAKFT